MLQRKPPSPRVPRIVPREEKTEQLVDTRHEVDQLVLELQKVKQEVSGEGWGLGQSLGLTGQERSSKTFQQRPLRPSCSKQHGPEPVLLRIAVGMTHVLVTVCAVACNRATWLPGTGFS